jgi:hypothetical protein
MECKAVAATEWLEQQREVALLMNGEKHHAQPANASDQPRLLPSVQSRVLRMVVVGVGLVG